MKLIYALIISCSVLFTATLQAAGEAHLLYHMGIGANGKYSVGGTLQNKGDSDIAAGYIVIVPVDGQCHPLTPVLGTWPALKPGEKYQFEIPVKGELKAYRVGSFAAFDAQGFNVAAIDDTQKIIAQRESAERIKCLSQK